MLYTLQCPTTAPVAELNPNLQLEASLEFLRVTHPLNHVAPDKKSRVQQVRIDADADRMWMAARPQLHRCVVRSIAVPAITAAAACHLSLLRLDTVFIVLSPCFCAAGHL